MLSARSSGSTLKIYPESHHFSFSHHYYLTAAIVLSFIDCGRRFLEGFFATTLAPYNQFSFTKVSDLLKILGTVIYLLRTFQELPIPLTGKCKFLSVAHSLAFPMSLIWWQSPNTLSHSKLLGSEYAKLTPASLSILCCFLCLGYFSPRYIWRSWCPSHHSRLCSEEFLREAFPDYLL